MHKAAINLREKAGWCLCNDSQVWRKWALWWTVMTIARVWTRQLHHIQLKTVYPCIGFVLPLALWELHHLHEPCCSSSLKLWWQKLPSGLWDTTAQCDRLVGENQVRNPKTFASMVGGRGAVTFRTCLMRQRHEERITIKEYEYEYISNMNINEYMCMHKWIYKPIYYIYIMEKHTWMLVMP